LNDFGVPEGILFRIKISANATDMQGQLLAEADAIRPRLPDQEDVNVDPLIQHMPADDIGEELWRVDFSGDMPLLKINKSIAIGVDQFLSDPQYRAVYAPAVMRQVLLRILVVERDGEDDDDDSWQAKWLRFASSVLGVGNPPDADDSESGLQNLDQLESWIDDAVEAFVSRSGLSSAFARATTLGAQE
jgi:hypothetical protein